MEDHNFNNDEFNPNDHDIEMDEIAKMHASADMKEHENIWLRDKADYFYIDFIKIGTPESISCILSMIESREIKLVKINDMLDNMIHIFQENEEYEKCDICLQIKTGVNDKF
jgi:hypothetical protein